MHNLEGFLGAEKVLKFLHSEIRMSTTKASWLERDFEATHCHYTQPVAASEARARQMGSAKRKRIAQNLFAQCSFCVADLANHSLYLHTHCGQNKIMRFKCCHEDQ
jgi:hypothetical protein